MSTIPRVPATSLREAFALQPDLLDAFWDLYGTMWMDGVVDHPTKEIVRLRNARVTDCGYCKKVRFSVARDEGVDEGRAALVEDGYEEAGLPARQVAALRFTDRFLHDPSPLPAELTAELTSEFGEDGLVELGLGLAMFVGFAKMLISLGLEPPDMPVTVVATPGSRERLATG